MIMKILEKYAFYFFLACMVALVSVYANQMRIKYKAEKKRSEALENTITGLNKKAETFQITMNDSLKFYAAKVEDLKMTKNNIQARYNDLLQAAKIKPKNVQGVSDIGMKTADTIFVPVQVDSFGGLRTNYHDPFTIIDVRISKDREAAVTYEIWDSLTLINEQKRHSILFGLIKWYETEKTTVISHNPKSKVVNLTSINVVK